MKDSQRIDLRADGTDVVIAGEAKDYGAVIELDTMRQILHRIPDAAVLELVYVRKLQKSYFNTSDSFEAEFPASKRLFFKIVIG
ncbi:hypothetical protein HK100_005980, partial [Physocladia obscura]